MGKENAPGKFPCRNWGRAYEDTNRLIGLISQDMADYLTDCDHKVAQTPATHNFDRERLVARWSHKHLAHLSGLGRFGVNAQMITPAGCAGRLGSLVTSTVIAESRVVEEDELCLFKRGEGCLECVSRCPVKAVSKAGIDRQRFWDRLNFNRQHLEALADMEESHPCLRQVCGRSAVQYPHRGFKNLSV